MKFPEIETISALYLRGEISLERLMQLLDQRTERGDRTHRPSRKATILGPLWQEP